MCERHELEPPMGTSSPDLRVHAPQPLDGMLTIDYTPGRTHGTGILANIGVVDARGQCRYTFRYCFPPKTGL